VDSEVRFNGEVGEVMRNDASADRHETTPNRPSSLARRDPPREPCSLGVPVERNGERLGGTCHVAMFHGSGDRC
jgi:hypothetical protein